MDHINIIVTKLIGIITVSWGNFVGDDQMKYIPRCMFDTRVQGLAMVALLKTVEVRWLLFP